MKQKVIHMNRMCITWRLKCLSLLLAVSASTAHADVFSDAQAAYQTGYYSKAADLFLAEAKLGRAAAQVFIGHMFDHGLGMRQDYGQAMTWYRRAADQGNPNAQFAIGVLYRKGLGVQADDKQAVNWYRKAAHQGHSAAENNLAYMLQMGQGIDQDVEQAAALYHRAAIKGLGSAQVHLARLYEQGSGVPRNPTLAINLLTMALANADTLPDGDVAFANERLIILKQAQLPAATSAEVSTSGAQPTDIKATATVSPPAAITSPATASQAVADSTRLPVTAARPWSCPSGLENTAFNYKVSNPVQDAGAIYLESKSLVRVCIVDSTGKATEKLLKPNSNIKVYGRPPFLVSSNDFKQARLIYQGRLVKLSAKPSQSVRLIPNNATFKADRADQASHQNAKSKKNSGTNQTALDNEQSTIDAMIGWLYKRKETTGTTPNQ
ncbi:MAG: tetratricopeptide repeat protein [Betaproteobacteria bacterium]